MAIVLGDTVIPAGVIPGVAAAAAIASGSLVPESGLVVGVFHANDQDPVVWNNGVTFQNVYNPANLRKCTPYSGSDLLGKSVQLTNKAVQFRGVVVQQLNTELDDTNGDGTQEPIVVVNTGRFTYLAREADVEEV